MKKENVISSNDKVQIHDVGTGEYKLPVTPDSEYVIDDSCFIPMSEAVKQLGLNPNFTGSENKTAYDFPDGKDSGIKIPINRTKNGKDIAEISTEIANQQENIASEIKKQQEFEQYQAEVQQRMEAVKPKE